MKRKLTLFLSAVMATSCLPMTVYAANFKDINEVAWAASTINSVADKGLLSGYEDGTFRAKNNVTYPEAMQMVYNALVKSGITDPIDAVTAYSYMAVLNTYKVPGWSQMAVAYGLDNGLITMQDVVTKFAGGNKAATREDVAMIFGNALAYRYDVDSKAVSAAEFLDYYKISNQAAPLVDLLKRLEIVSGDTSKRFNPQNNINRAEMAVMLNKTYSVLTEGIGSTGKIVDFQNNKGDFFYIEVEFENGKVQGFHATPEGVVAYDADGKKMALSRLGEGDNVRVVHNGDMLLEVYVTDGISAQQKYDITGYITSMKDNTVTVENENTGETDKYLVDRDCYCYADGVQVSRSELEDLLKEKYNLHAYAGIIVEVKRERDDNNQWEYVTEVTEIHVTFTEDYTKSGKVDSMSSKSVRFKPSGSSNTLEVSFADDCEFYWEGSKFDVEDLIAEYKAGTTYVKVNVNNKDKATEVYLSADAFEEGSVDNMEDKIVNLEDLSEQELEVSVGSKDYSYKLDSKNPIENIKFYIWDGDDEDGDWDEVDEDDAIEYVERMFDDNEKLYCQLDFNSGGKISAVEISETKKAWSEDDDQNERKGTVDSLKKGVLKFRGSNTEYTMLDKYNTNVSAKDEENNVVTGRVDGKTVKNPLSIDSAYTSSLKVFEKMANDSKLELYAEIISDSDGKVQSVEARLTKAEGKMVEFNREEEYIKIETASGEYKLNCRKSPTLTDEDEDTFTLEDIEGEKYAGHDLVLGFNSTGIVNEITVVDGPKSGSGSTKVKGIATAANNGLEVEGKSGTYEWISKTSDITIRNYSGPSESLSTIKKMIEDDAVEVYVEALLNDKDKVESIKVYVKSAEGKIDKDGYDKYLRIETESGNTFSFDVKSSVVIDIDGYDEDALEEGKADGTAVAVTFGSDGLVSKIAKAE